MISGHHEPTFPALGVAYLPLGALKTALADPTTLAVFRFSPSLADGFTHPRLIDVGLSPHNDGMLEIWRSSLPVTHGCANGVRWMRSGNIELACVEIDEPAGEDIAAAAEFAYGHLARHQLASDTPHVLRVWNYLDALTEGEGDDERYRLFCVGRVRGWGQIDTQRLPAATCIGRYDGVRRLQVYWLSSRHPGTAFENSRQTSAFHYPREYGPQPPTFSRAMLPSSFDRLPLLLSGTAAILGHQSLHAGAPTAQLEQTLANIDHLVQAARSHRSELSASLSHTSPLKVYVRQQQDIAAIKQQLLQCLPSDVPCLVLHAEVCRPELLVEIEAMHGHGGASP